jgi:hypothetical protein
VATGPREAVIGADQVLISLHYLITSSVHTGSACTHGNGHRYPPPSVVRYRHVRLALAGRERGSGDCRTGDRPVICGLPAHMRGPAPAIADWPELGGPDAGVWTRPRAIGRQSPARTVPWLSWKARAHWPLVWHKTAETFPKAGWDSGGDEHISSSKWRVLLLRGPRWVSCFRRGPLGFGAAYTGGLC